MNDHFCHDEIEEPVNDRIFSNQTLLKTHSNQERDNTIHHFHFPEIIEELVE